MLKDTEQLERLIREAVDALAEDSAADRRAALRRLTEALSGRIKAIGTTERSVLLENAGPGDLVVRTPTGVSELPARQTCQLQPSPIRQMGTTRLKGAPAQIIPVVPARAVIATIEGAKGDEATVTIDASMLPPGGPGGGTL